ncbi:MAG: helix-turn-helix domain-containing protein [Armatimonadetes bacterium]|nr:helix-turn-helix domain-containing protein [Armatimonadota bacterium]
MTTDADDVAIGIIEGKGIAMSKFGKRCREARLARGMGLRRFCVENDFDPALISKIERGRIKLPGEEFRSRLAEALGLEGAEKSAFLDLGHVEAGTIPPDLLTDEQAMELLPAVMRSIRGEKVGDETVDKLIEIIKRS